MTDTRPFQKTASKVFDFKQNNRKAKFEELKTIYQAKLSEYVKLYFSSIEENDEEENKKVYDIINKDWKDICHKANATQKIIKLSVDAFEKNVEHLLKPKEDVKNEVVS